MEDCCVHSEQNSDSLWRARNFWSVLPSVSDVSVVLSQVCC